MIIPVILLSGTVFFHSCIDALEFTPTEGEKLLVVDGKLSASAGVQTLRLSETGVVGRSDNFSPVTGATITLQDDEGRVVGYSETAPGIYQFSGNLIQGTSGRTYTLHIQSRGKTYVSKAETMPQRIEADSSFFSIANSKFVYVYSSVQIPADLARGPFLKWRINNVYQVNEVYCGPFDPTNVCYVTQTFSNQLLPILDGSLLARGEAARPFVAVKEADKAFGEVAYFNLYMETLTPDAFKYWNKVSLLLTQSGSFFDAPPGAIRGNIINVNNPEELVLGYFYAAPEDTTHVKVLASDFLPYTINPYCGVAGFVPSPFPPECCTCTRLPNSTLEKPDYWD
ncbi:MAG: DUF4249 domain-containing protein [Saprospiraceae bacterium]|nr:DUF4249 domain-containing protein [Saprospiraceae bacterium]